MIFLRPTEIGLARECLRNHRRFGRTFLLSLSSAIEFLHSLGQTLTSGDVRFMSAFHPIATKSWTSRQFGFGPTCDIAPALTKSKSPERSGLQPDVSRKAAVVEVRLPSEIPAVTYQTGNELTP
jgi:hypothetical protein